MKQKFQTIALFPNNKNSLFSKKIGVFPYGYLTSYRNRLFT